MTLKSEIDDIVSHLPSGWHTTNWQSSRTDVPDPDAMGYSEGKNLDATFLYADMVDSSGLVAAAGKEVVATVIASYLNACVKVIRAHQGEIRSFDGDRVMGVFAGPGKETRAVIAGLKINYVVNQVLDPGIQRMYSEISRSGWHLRHVTGMATGPTLMVRAGIKYNSDLVSIGAGPNLAAKLSDIRDGRYSTIIGAGTYRNLERRAIVGSDEQNMWTGPCSIGMGNRSYNYYKSNYHWEV